MSASRTGLLWIAAWGLALAASAGAGAADRGADGRFDKRTSSNFVLYQDVDIDRVQGLHGSRRFEQDVLAVLERGYGLVAESLSLRPRRPITVVIHDPAVFDARFAGLFRFPAAGFYGGSIHVRGDRVVHQDLIRVLHHELVHAAFDAEAPSLVLPAWLNEGLAEWLEARAVGKRLMSRGELDALSGVARQGGLFSLADLSRPTFSGFGPRAARLAYLQSYAFVDFLARNHGARALRQLCAELIRVGHLDRAMRRAFRADLTRLEQRFVADLL